MSFRISSLSFAHPVPRWLKPVLLAAGLAAIGGAWAGQGGDEGRAHRGGGGGGDPTERMAQHLQLDEAQKAGVKAIFERNRPAQRQLRERTRAHWQALAALEPGSPDYSARAQALADEAGTLARDRVLARTQLNAELATVLTPEQIKKFQARKSHGGGPHGRWQHRRHGGPDAKAEAPAAQS